MLSMIIIVIVGIIIINIQAVQLAYNLGREGGHR